MSTSNIYLAVFLGSKNSARWTAWNALSEAERRAKEQEGIVTLGGPLGKTKKVSQGGISDVSNHMGAFTVVRADSHQAAAEMFENHPHFAIFPGEAVEIMPVLPIPGG